MSRSVPLSRRNLLSDGRRIAVTLLGVGLAVALMLLIQGLWTGTLTRITSYEDGAGVQLFVAERGTRSFLSDVSAIPATAVGEVRAAPGVDTADPIAVRPLILDLRGTKVPVTMIGARIGGLGGPWALEAGRAVGDLPGRTNYRRDARPGQLPAMALDVRQVTTTGDPGDRERRGAAFLTAPSPIPETA